MPKCPGCMESMDRRNYKYGDVYVCDACDVRWYLDDMGNPRGQAADAPTRAARIEAHSWFDRLWKTGIMGRKAAYRWLRKKLKMTSQECHISNFDREMCEQVVQLSKERYEAQPPMTR